MRRCLAIVVAFGCLALGAEAAQAVPAISIDDPTVAEDTGTNNTVTFTVSLSEPVPAGGDFNVDWVTANGTSSTPAAAPSDYQTSSGTLTFAAGDTSKQVQVTVVGDLTDEFDEQFRVTLANVQPGVNATLGDPVGVATITDDDDPPLVSVDDVTVQGSSVSTGVNRLVIFNISLNRASGKTVRVDYRTQDPAPAGPHPEGFVPAEACDPPPAACAQRTDGDYVPKTGFKEFAPGTTSLQVEVVAIGDSLDFNKYLELVIESRTHLTSPTADFVAGDVGAPIIVAGQPNTIAEVVDKDEVILSNPADNGSGVSFFFDNATHNNGNVFGGTNQTIGDGTGIGKIPSSGPPVKITGVTVNEGAAGTISTAQLAVTLDTASPQQVRVKYKSADGTAKAPGDYTALPANQELVFAPGEISKTINVPIHGNDLNEADKAFSVILSDPVNATLTTGNATGVVTIKNDDVTPGIVAPDVTVPEPRAGTATAVVNVSLSAPSTRTLTATYDTRDGSAIAGTNYGRTNGTLTFTPGQTTKQVEIPVAGDGEVTEDKDFTLAIQNTADGGGEVVARVVITESDLTADATPALSINDATVRDAGASSAVFTVRLDRALNRRVLVDYATADGSATAPGDYTPVSGTLTFGPGETTRTISVPITGNSRPRFNESFSVTLSNPVSARIARGTGVGIIINAASESLPFSVAGRSVNATTLLCRRGRRCRGLLVRWTAPAAGTVRVRVTAVLPASGRRAGSDDPASKRAKRIVLVQKSYRVKRGDRSARVRRAASRTTTTLLRQLRRAKVRRVSVTVTFTDRFGARRLSNVERPLRY